MNPREQRQAQFERKLSVTGPVTLDLSARSGRLRIRRSEDGFVMIRGVLKQSSIFSWIQSDEELQHLASNPPVQQAGNTIQIGDVADRWLLRRVHLLVDITTPAETIVRALGDSADLDVAGINGPVDCETDSGEIQIRGIHSRVSASSDSGAIYIREVDGPVETQTDSGEIRITNVNSQVCASSDSGGIRIREVKGSIEARTDSGEIEALQIGGRIEVKTDSGRIELSQTEARPVYAQSDSGGITLKLAEGAGYTVRASTDGGRIEIPEMQRARASGHEVEGMIQGGGPIVSIETDSGDIEVRVKR